MLDGGHLFFYIIEAIRGKPVGERAQEISFKIGFAILMGVMLFTLWNDIARFGVIEYLVGLFK
jgi:regulator of sigma E protease